MKVPTIIIILFNCSVSLWKWPDTYDNVNWLPYSYTMSYVCSYTQIYVSNIKTSHEPCISNLLDNLLSDCKSILYECHKIIKGHSMWVHKTPPIYFMYMVKCRQRETGNLHYLFQRLFHVAIIWIRCVVFWYHYNVHISYMYYLYLQKTFRISQEALLTADMPSNVRIIRDYM